MNFQTFGRDTPFPRCSIHDESQTHSKMLVLKHSLVGQGNFIYFDFNVNLISRKFGLKVGPSFFGPNRPVLGVIRNEDFQPCEIDVFDQS